MGDDDLICFCMSVTRGEIKAAILSGNCDIPALKRTVGCCTGCGTCEERVKKVIQETKTAAINAGTDSSANPKKAG